MFNIKQKLVGNRLTLEVDLSQELGPSTSGKTLLIASTQGNQAVDGWKGPGRIMFGLNVMKKNDQQGQ